MPNYIVISRETHADKRWQRYSSYAFSAGEAVVPVLVAELARATMSLPLAFIQQGAEFQLVAVLGLEPGKNLFVAPDGRWQGSYIPAALRSHPFRLATTPEGQQVLCVDADSGLLTDGPTGEALFNADGTPAKAVSEVLNFLTQLEGNRSVTAAACAALQAQQLIVPWDVTVQRDEGEHKVEGLYKVDEAALNALADADFMTLRRSGALKLGHYQLLSMQHLSTLGQLAQARTMVAGLTATELDLLFLGESEILDYPGML
jgi:hypothetical protein